MGGKAFLIAALIISFSLMVGLATAQYYLEDDPLLENNYFLEDNISINLVQSSYGTGFISSYSYVNMPDPLGNFQGVAGQGLSGMAAKHLAHGSGKIDQNSRILAYSYYSEIGVIPTQGGAELEPVIDDDDITAIPYINLTEDTSMIYSPLVMAIGNGYYARNPISQRSLLEDSTCIKNLDTGSSLYNEIEYAKAFQKKLEAQADYIDLANTTMKFDETIKEGTARVGALELEEIPTYRDMEEYTESGEEPEVVSVLFIKKSKPLIETDEIYIGDFHLNASISLSSLDEDDDDEDCEDGECEWLPCCFGGYLTMPTNYRKGPKGFGTNVNSIFDCTCWRQPGECAITSVQY
jgi:hypothetical protein